MSQDEIIRRLHPTLQLASRDLLYRADKEGIRLVITEGVRSTARQAEVYALGRDDRGNVVDERAVRSWAPPGWSFHNYGMAIDVAPLDARGNPHWPEDDALWTRIGEIGEAVGLEWGGRWPGKKIDRPHFQHRGGLTIEAVRRGERPRFNAGEEPTEELPL